MLIYNEKTKSVSQETAIRVPEEHEVVWIHLHAPMASELTHILCDLFHCHPLIVEDCVMLNQRPKLDRYKDNIFITFYSLSKSLKMSEIAIVVGNGYVVTVSKEEQPFIETLTKELLTIEGRMEHAGEVLYEILDRCVDEYVDTIYGLEDQLDRMERSLLRNPYMKVAHDIYHQKRTIHKIRRVFADERTVLGGISHDAFPFTQPERDVYFVDILDHLSKLIDSLDTTRESLNGLLELQVNLKSDRMNEIMKTLTIVSSIFLPLTFIVGGDLY